MTKNGSGENTIVYLSPESIIKGKFAILNPNIFEDITNPKEDASDPSKDQYYDTSSENSDGSKGDKAVSYMIKGRTELRDTVAGWYYALRNLAIIALLSILVYVGIRMIISTLSQDKAKYKMMLKDWLVALCLVMVMHYIMIATLNITSDITQAIGTSGQNTSLMEKIMRKIDIINDSTEEDNVCYIDENNNPTTEGNGELHTIGDAFAYELVLLGVIGYTLIFAFKYLIRMITIIFLILVAPITAITYPIDKISDGKAQAFNMWFQEFLYEVIIQPFHLLIYVVLVGSATTLADTNWLYSIMCFAVMIPAEKFIKQMFGFKDKLSSPLGAFAGGAVASQLMSKAFSGGGSSNDKGTKVEGNSESDDSFRENKLKVGLPGSDEGTGTPTRYDTDKDSETSNTPTGTETPGGSPQGDNPQGDSGDEQNNNPEDNTSTPSDADLDEEDSWYAYNDRLAEQENNESTPSDADLDEEDSWYAYNNRLAEQEANSQKQEETDETDLDEEDSWYDYNDRLAQQEENAQPEEDENDAEEVGENDEDSEPETKGIYKPNSKIDKLTNAAHAIREHNDKKLMAKYGTKNRGLFYRDANGNIKRGAAGKYLGKKGAKYGKKAIKGFSTLAAAGVAGVVGTMFGQGGKAALAGAAVGSKIGNKINDKTSSAYKTAKEYGKEAVYATKDEDQRRKEKVAEMMNKPDQIAKASKSFSKRNDGKIASKEELDQELAQRAKFKETGLTDSQIDDAMEIYHDDDVKKLGDEKAFEMAVTSAKVADRYSAADFEDPKKMKNAYDSMMRQYEALGVNQDLADENVRAILGNAAATKSIKQPALPEPSRKEAYKEDEKNKKKAIESYGKRHKNSEGKPIKPTKKQQDHELEMGYNLRRAGIGEEDRDKFFDEYLTNDEARKEAQTSLGIADDTELTEQQEMMVDDELERRFEIKAKLGIIDDDKQKDGETEEQWKARKKQQEEGLTEHIKASEQFLKDTDKAEKPTNGQVYREVKHRLQVKDSYHVDDSEISDIRKGEEEFVKKSTDKDGARAVIEAQRYESKKAISKIAASEVLREEDKPELMKRTGKEKLTKAQYQRKLFETHSKEELSDDKYMDKFANETLSEVKERNQYSDEHARKLVTEIINGGRGMAGIETEYKFTRN